MFQTIPLKVNGQVPRLAIPTVDVSKPHALQHTQNKPATHTVDVSSQTATATPDLEETWCICKEPEHGWVVECHNEAACDIRWFHFDCVCLKKCLLKMTGIALNAQNLSYIDIQ